MTPISRAEIIARARTWAVAPRAYSQEAYDEISGYRLDCSGFVSMAWALRPPGETTVELPDYCVLIDIDDLRRGDAVMNGGPGTWGDAGHVMLFDAWSDETRTSFWSYEQVSAGTVHRIVPFPAAPYQPYRLRVVTGR
ncbi:hypothetical protein AB0M02_34570 [Actinoplanes sp. NPDC051861]|uniref:hypothetical protein n=1 Tax=Actinoplanes sp. NPDC051861 TaxID=3155170 RepID=UPI003422EF44